MATVTFFTRTTKATNPDKRINIRVRFRHGKTISIYAKSGLQILPHHFSNETHTINKRAKYKDKNVDKQYLDDLEKEILKSYKDLKEKPTSDWLNDVIDRFRFPDKYKATPVTLFSFIQDFIDNAPRRINRKTGKTVSYKVVREYHATFGYLKEYSKTIGKEISFNDINLDFYDDFVKFLESKGLALNTVGRKIQTLKVFLNDATARDINTNQIYKSSRFYVPTEESDNIYLSETELEKILNINFSKKPSFNRVRDLFLIGCYTGLRFSDWDKVNSNNIENGFLTLKQQKTGQSVVIPIHPVVNQILGKYEGNLPKLISNQKFNNYLKQVARLADLKQAITKQTTRGGKVETVIKYKWELVTTHTARRSFATNMYRAGIPSITIMAVTGHRTESAFLKYIKVTPQEHAQRMRDIWLSIGNHLKVAK